LTDLTTGEVICISCGTVISEWIAENRPEWSNIDINELYSGSRKGMPMSLAIHDLGLSTAIEIVIINPVRTHIPVFDSVVRVVGSLVVACHITILFR
jgi:transcription initiation factor TFIIIB Brf1 subunit/transcription initiation factor TFIIB